MRNAFYYIALATLLTFLLLNTSANSASPPPNPPTVAGLLGSADPILLAIRIALIPFLIWWSKTIILYSFNRMHLARTIYNDAQYRVKFAASSVLATRAWLDRFDENGSELPFLRTGREPHVIYNSLQDDIRKCAWGKEKHAIRLFYRDFEEVEHRAGKIEEIYSSLLENMGKDEIKAQRKFYKEQIHYNLAIMEKIAAFWLSVAATKQFPQATELLSDIKNIKVDEIPRSLLLGKTWYLFFLASPILFFILTLATIIVEPSSLAIWLLLLTYIFCVVFIFLIYRSWENNRIHAQIILRYDQRLDENLSRKNPPSQ